MNRTEERLHLRAKRDEENESFENEHPQRSQKGADLL